MSSLEKLLPPPRLPPGYPRSGAKSTASIESSQQDDEQSCAFEKSQSEGIQSIPVPGKYSGKQQYVRQNYELQRNLIKSLQDEILRLENNQDNQLIDKQKKIIEELESQRKMLLAVKEKNQKALSRLNDLYKSGNISQNLYQELT